MRSAQSVVLFTALAVAVTADGAAIVSVDPTSKLLDGPVTKRIMGCHHDSGYTHQPRFYSAQLVFDESFETFGGNKTWSAVGDAVSELSTSVTFHGMQSWRLATPSGGGRSGVANRGIGGEGLFIQANKSYEGYLFVRAAAAMDLSVELQDFDGKVLAKSVVSVRGGADFERVEFSLAPSASTECVDATGDTEVDCGKMGPQPGHVCIRCGGQLAVVLESATEAEAFIDFVWLQPGPWALYDGLPVLRSAVETLKLMGITTIRQGGSYACGPNDGAYYQWQRWTGPVWQRPSINATWGASAFGGWGPFEFIDMCNHADIEPILTTTDSGSPEELADLIEYCHGGNETKMGAARTADGHPEPYSVFTFELGNEEYNKNFVAQVAAMEKRAEKLGLGGKIRYMFPNNDGPSADDLAALKALNIDGLEPRILPDVHIGGGGAISVARKVWAAHPDFASGMINAETNAGTHDMTRALSEAADLNEWMNTAAEGGRYFARTASFCSERSGHYDAFDQGISFFLPNATWLQPPGWVHNMVSTSWQPVAVNSSCVAPLSCSAQTSESGNEMVVRVVNTAGVASAVDIHVAGKGTWSGVNATTIASDDVKAANTPADPLAIAPKKSTVSRGTDGTLTVEVAANSYTVVALKKE